MIILSENNCIINNIMNSIRILKLIVFMSAAIVAQAVPAAADAQEPVQETVSGTVTDTRGVPLSGVAVICGNSGTVTDLDGKFSLDVPAGSDITFSALSYVSQTIKASMLHGVTIALEEDTFFLDNAIVVGFGTQKKENMTGAVEAVSAEVLESRPVQNVAQAIQGIIPGLNISQNQGLLDMEPTVNIRGLATISQGSSGSPLILVDGVESNWNMLNPNDIESISVLKDASSAAIYGAKAAFGVIIVTTKKGKSDGVSINYNNSFRFASPLHLNSQADSYSWALFMNDADISSDHFNPEWLQRIKDYQDGLLKDPLVVGADGRYENPYHGGAHANVDWAQELMNKVIFSQEHSASVSCGNDKIQGYASINYLDMGGFLKYGNDTFDRLSSNLKLNYNIAKFLSLSYNVRYSQTDYDKPQMLTDDDYINWGRQQWPMFPVYDNNGNLYAGGGRAYDHKYGGRSKTKRENIIHLVQLKATPLKGWNITGEFSYNGLTTFNHRDWQKTYLYDIDNSMYEYGSSSGVSEETVFDRRMTYNIYSDYAYTTDNGHSIKIMAGMQADDFRSNNIGASRDGIIHRDFPDLSNTTSLGATGEKTDPSIWGQQGRFTTAGFFGRFNYDYDGRYLFETNLRYDGSSRFRRSGRWVLSPSVSAGWNIAREGFWSDITQYVNLLKLRASYGKLANQNTSAWYPTYVKMPLGTADSSWIIDGQQQNTAWAPDPVSESLTWETVRTIDIGLDWGAFSNRLTGSFDWYTRYTEDMLGNPPVLPSVFGATVPAINNTSLKTTGWELTVSWKDLTKFGLDYGIRVSLSDDRSIITEYDSPSKALDEYYTGKVIGDIWGYKSMGIAKSDREMKNHLVSLPNGGQSALGSGWAAGDMMYNDVNGDGRIDNGANTLDDHGDLVVIGNDQPRYRISLDFTAGWKGIDFRMFWQGVLKMDYSPGPDNSTFFGCAGESIWWSCCYDQHLDYFRADPDHPLGQNLDAYYTRPVFSDSKKNQQHQTHYLQNAAYLRLKNLQIGYTLPQRLTEKIRIKQLRFFVSGENLLTITGLSDLFDPETLYGGHYGYGYPLARTWSFGLSVNF